MVKVNNKNIKIGDLYQHKIKTKYGIMEIKEISGDIIIFKDIDGKELQHPLRDVGKTIFLYYKEANIEEFINLVSWEECIKDKKNNSIYREEGEYLSKVLNVFKEIIFNNDKKIDNNREQISMLTSSTQEEIPEKAFRRNENISLGNKNENLKKEMLSPYTSRFDIENNGEIETYYIGDADFRYNDTTYVINWRSDLGDKFNRKTITKFKIRNKEYTVDLRRNIIIENSRIEKIYDSYSKKENGNIADEYLLEILKRKKKI